MYTHTHTHTHARAHVCTYVRTYVRMYVCMILFYFHVLGINRVPLTSTYIQCLFQDFAATAIFHTNNCQTNNL